MPEPEHIVLRFGADGGSAFYSDTVAEALRPSIAGIGRLTNIEPSAETGMWEVRLASSGELLFSHASRSRCLEWEHDNAAALLHMHGAATGKAKE